MAVGGTPFALPDLEAVERASTKAENEGKEDEQVGEAGEGEVSEHPSVLQRSMLSHVRAKRVLRLQG